MTRNPRRSKRARTSKASPRCTASGLISTSVRSTAPFLLDRGRELPGRLVTHFTVSRPGLLRPSSASGEGRHAPGEPAPCPSLGGGSLTSVAPWLKISRPGSAMSASGAARISTPPLAATPSRQLLRATIGPSPRVVARMPARQPRSNSAAATRREAAQCSVCQRPSSANPRAAPISTSAAQSCQKRVRLGSVSRTVAPPPSRPTVAHVRGASRGARPSASSSASAVAASESSSAAPSAGTPQSKSLFSGLAIGHAAQNVPVASNAAQMSAAAQGSRTARRGGLFCRSGKQPRQRKLKLLAERIRFVAALAQRAGELAGVAVDGVDLLRTGQLDVTQQVVEAAVVGEWKTRVAAVAVARAAVERPAGQDRRARGAERSEERAVARLWRADDSRTPRQRRLQRQALAERDAVAAVDSIDGVLFP